MRRQRQRRRVQNGPDRLEPRIAGVAEARAAPRRCTAGVSSTSQPSNTSPSRARQLFAEPHRRDVVRVRHRAPELDALAQPLADRVALRVPLVRHGGGALVVVDGLACGGAQAGKVVRQRDLFDLGAGLAEPRRRVLDGRDRLRLRGRPERRAAEPDARRARRASRSVPVAPQFQHVAQKLDVLERARHQADGVEAFGGRETRRGG